MKGCPFKKGLCLREDCLAWKEIYDWDEEEYRQVDRGYCKLIPDKD